MARLVLQDMAVGLGGLAEIARGEEDYWENEAAGWWGTTVQWSPSPRSNAPLVQIELGNPPTPLSMQEPMPQAMDASVNRTWLLTEPVAVQRRVLRAIAHHAGIPLEFKHVEEILGFAADRGPSGKALTLPSGWKVSRDPESLVFHAPDSYQPKPTAHDYEYVLPVPGRVNVPEAGSLIEAVRIPHQPDASECNRDELLDAALLPKTLRVRNWRAGDRFWPAHTKSAKKIKELLQERHVAQKIRKAWPVVVHGDEIVWVRGFPVPARLQAKPGRDAVLIQEKFLTPGSLAE
jgi:tRNA(Ile)-lysidine synthetase-like protein